MYNPWNGRVGPNDAVQLFVTDYTTNSQLYNYSDTSEVRTPGQITLQVSIFGNQSEPLLGLKTEQLVGRVVFLRNVRPKTTTSDFLEATMVEDNKYPNRRDVCLVSEKNPAPADWVAQFAACVQILGFTGLVEANVALRAAAGRSTGMSSRALALRQSSTPNPTRPSSTRSVRLPVSLLSN